MSNYLTNDQIHDLVKALSQAGFCTLETRDDLLIGIHRGFALNLEERRTVWAQITKDLDTLSSTPYLLGDEVPLKTWLENGLYLLRSSARPEQALFQETLNQVAASSEAILAQVHGTSIQAPAGTELEQIIHRDDLLAYTWLTGAFEAGKAVARLTVPRYEAGQAIVNPGSGRPVLYRGTGWLIGPQHLITNHHVVNARSESEPDAAEPDLRLQAQHTTVQFDYDCEGAEGETAGVEELAAWSVRDAQPPLDFAILKLNAPSSRRPLTLAPSVLAHVIGAIFPANIIQHPQGNPKALGIRNNLVSSLEPWEVRYFTDTMQGSSGSPVCNDAWQVIALHRATKFLNVALNFQGKTTAWVNRGVRIDRLVEHLKQNTPALWAEIKAVVV